ncbi:hypothetical protein NPIL_21971, partial [Nephila pilipes]
ESLQPCGSWCQTGAIRIVRTRAHTGSVSEACSLLQKRLPRRRQMRTQVQVPHGTVGKRQSEEERGRRIAGIMLVSDLFANPPVVPRQRVLGPNAIYHGRYIKRGVHQLSS